MDSCYALVEHMSTFWSCPNTLREPEINSSRLMNLAEEISRQRNIEAVTHILLGAF